MSEFTNPATRAAMLRVPKKNNRTVVTLRKDVSHAYTGASGAFSKYDHTQIGQNDMVAVRNKSVPSRAQITSQPDDVNDPMVPFLLGKSIGQNGYSSKAKSSFGLKGKSLRFRVAKRSIDIVGAGVGLVLLAPLLIGCALAIKATSRGPVFFRQNRYGLNSEMFSIYKFRTMHTDLGDSSGVQQTKQNDPRITRVGAFLRKTSFDELPQLLNVLNGTMSLVGPRPHVPNMLAAGIRYEDFDPRYLDRHAMVPGITGLAQVNGFRGETQTYEAAKGRINKDIEYCRSASIKMDLKIILKTIRCEFLSGSGF
ncbi:sugar transferase [uncultured Maritimibacter sp.]|jgi:lipopolysaccharide/colanic/teichoic acid biosynthesis glycosyltransferase|uniref:sugar transferase n=1 Tax=uncultured Maritimibacter sp. TaxID=991866 RepID=UPI00262048BD|nr:sugar transferase [uncultured Maritimibacter sp.]